MLHRYLRPPFQPHNLTGRCGSTMEIAAAVEFFVSASLFLAHRYPSMAALGSLSMDITASWVGRLRPFLCGKLKVMPASATVVVVGPPAVGKTTLANRLANVLGGTHVSVGAALRNRRRTGYWSREEEDGYQGLRPFPNATVQEVIQTALEGAGPAPIVLDGSVGLIEALCGLAVMPLAELRLEAADTVRLARLRNRVHAEVRDDDTMTIMRRRTALWQRYDRTQTSIPWDRVILDASVSPGELLADALTQLLTIGVEAIADSEVEPLVLREGRPELSVLYDDAVAAARPLLWREG